MFYSKLDYSKYMVVFLFSISVYQRNQANDRQHVVIRISTYPNGNEEL